MSEIMWQSIINHLCEEDRTKLLKRVLKTRVKFFPFGLNGRMQFIRRNEVRDYLRNKINGSTS